MAEISAVADDLRDSIRGSGARYRSKGSSASLIGVLQVVASHRGVFLSTVGGLLAACLLYCLIAPKVYEGSARIALRGVSRSPAGLDYRDNLPSGSFASGQVQLETLANEFRSEQLAWNVMVGLRLDRSFGSFGRKFPGFQPEHPDPDARAYLVDEFQKNLTVETIPRTLVLQIRFRSHDAALSAAVVNALIHEYDQRQREARIEATKDATSRLSSQLDALKNRVDRDDQELIDFQKRNEILDTPGTLTNGRPSEVEHTAELSEVDALSRELVNAATDRILSEAEFRAAQSGDPELVLASDAKLQTPGDVSTAILQKLRARRSELEQEQAQLRIEHGPNFPRVAEIRSQMQDVDLQIKAEDAKLVQRFHSAWKTAVDREQLLRKSLSEASGAGLKVSAAAMKYAVMRQEADANQQVYLHALQQSEEAGLAAGSFSSDIDVIDYARQPVKPASPNLPVYMSIGLFVSAWLGLGVVFFRESMRKKALQIAVLLACALTAGSTGRAQAPTPSTSGLPTGVARIPQSSERKSVPNAKEAPAVWGVLSSEAGVPAGAVSATTMPMPAPIGPGDLLEVTEAHTPEMRGAVRVTEAGTITLNLAGEVHIGGMDERAAARAVEAALLDRGMLLHPQVTVLVTAYAGQDVSVMGEVARPGVYSYTVHHRLLDLISAASGLAPNAGRLVTITHRNDPGTVVPVVLDPTGKSGKLENNPELLPGDLVQVSRAGLVYVVGDVIRPGGFPVDPVQTTTAVQALSLAWGPGQNAALTKAILIREEPGGRTLTTLNLKRMLRGQDPDIPIRDRDILFVPDSMAKNLWNRTMESVIQSAAGVSIYAGLVYSQRF